jgi:four helix bundle protein
MHRYKELKVWQKSMDLVLEVYKLTRTFPDDERFGLISQMNRSAVSIVSNIAEGAGRNNPREFYQFLGIANGSLAELETQIEICKRLNISREYDFQALLELTSYIGKMINKLQRSLPNSNHHNISEPDFYYNKFEDESF